MNILMQAVVTKEIPEIPGTDVAGAAYEKCLNKISRVARKDAKITIQGIEKANSVDPTDVMLALDQMAEENEPIHLPIGDAYWGGAQRYGGLKHQLVTPIHMMDIHNGESRLLEVLPPPSDAELVPLE